MTLLREEAERILSQRTVADQKSPKRKKDLTELLHDLQIYQVEMEMQNDELKLSQAALENERHRFERLFDLAPVAYFVLDEVAVIKECNDFAVSLLDLKRSLLIDRRFQNFIFSEDSNQFYLFIRKLVLSQTSISTQVRLIKSGRRIVYAELQGVVIIDPATTKKMFYLGVIDITDKHFAAVQQREIYERLQMALNASDAGTWEVRPKTGEIKLDDSALKILGLKRENFDGKFSTLIDKVHPEDQAKFDLALRTAMIRSKNLQVEYRMLDENGEIRYLEARGHLVILEQLQEYFIGLITNITRRKLLEKEAEELKANQQKNILITAIETQESERTRISNALHDSVQQLLYGVSLKLQQTTSLADKSFSDAKKFIDLAIKETRNIAFELAPSILTDYGLCVAIPEAVSRFVSPNLSITHELKGCEKRFDSTTEIFIFRIVQELLNNVIKHSKATKAHLELKKQKNIVTIKMKDNGAGFAANSGKLKGTGLRSIRNRIELYNGSMNITSSKNKGTTVTIQLHNIK